ncbi:DUF4147 domain-containing protein [Chitinophaga horti]|uniref:DUF4147 domain-containing protein n=1 Tax=Chitinophaga horti TaxID=2920382 RepID=A0ABY6IX51_9BACT|nr:DUF4147 domain-containing protein [Chitinophaga horti]UYQ91870.1 DUF4147 domain-containing protein [Chitinophaga horti]
MHPAVSIFHAAIRAVQPSQIIPPCVRWQDGLYINDQPVPLNGRLFLIAAGKAAAAMALETEKIIGPQLTAGLVITKHEHGLPLQYCRLIEAGHPLPDEHSIQAGEAVKTMLTGLTANDVVILLLSGGASSLLADLPEGMTLQQLQAVFDQLIKSGAGIHEINTIRKHLSHLKGGGLANMTHPAQLYVLALSDVVGDQPDVIGSGPASPDTSSLEDAQEIAHRYELKDLPLHETPKPGDAIFQNIHYHLAGNNRMALNAAKQQAEQSGYHTSILTDTATGVVEDLCQQILQAAHQYKGPLPACLLMGGESTVIVTGNGKGGRNQQLALLAGQALPAHLTILCGGTDGTDGPTDAAGAMVNADIMKAATALGRDAQVYLANNDAYHFFEQTEGLIHTGPTQTNVMDIIIILIERH